MEVSSVACNIKHDFINRIVANTRDGFSTLFAMHICQNLSFIHLIHTLFAMHICQSLSFIHPSHNVGVASLLSQLEENIYILFPKTLHRFLHAFFRSFLRSSTS